MLYLLHIINTHVTIGFDAFRHLYNNPFVQQIFFVSHMSYIGLAEANDLLHPVSRLQLHRL